MICAFCHQERFFGVLDVIASGEFLLDACCGAYEETLRDDVAYAMELPPHQRIRFLAPLRAALEEAGLDVRSLVAEDLNVRLEYGIELCPVDRETAKAFIREHHRHNKPPVSWKWGHGIRRADTGEMIAVAMVGRPVARHLASRGWIEVNRVCVDPSQGERAFNASSMLYAAAAREAKKRGAPRIITYTREDEDGASLRAAGWKPEHVTKAESWHRDGRPRVEHELIRKVRWALELAPQRQLARAA